MVVRRCEVRRHFFLAMEFIALEEEPTLAGLCEQMFTRNTYLLGRTSLSSLESLFACDKVVTYLSDLSIYLSRPDTCGTLAAFWLRVLTNG